jgi:hypothetical protein
MVAIPQTLFDVYNSFADDFINLNFGVNCTVFLPSLKVQCDNCVFDTINNKSSNMYLAGGPIPFTFGVCPWCDGNGFKEIPNSSVIKMKVYFSRKNWIQIVPNINIPDGSVQTIGFLSDLPKIKAAQFVRINSDVAGYINYDYTLFGEPFPHGFKQNRYFIAYWKRS